MVSVFVPILYLAVLIGGLSTFSYFYRRRKSSPISQIDEWFPPNTARDLYFSLQATDNVPDATLKAALLVRAVEDIKRLQWLQTRKSALNNLLQRGGAGDDLWNRFLRLEEEMKDEVMDVAHEAVALQEGWNQVIFATANEIYLNDLARQKLSKILPLAKEVKDTLGTDFGERVRKVGEITKNRIKEEKEGLEKAREEELRAAEEVRQRAARELLEMEERERQMKKKSGSPKSHSPSSARKKK